MGSYSSPAAIGATYEKYLVDNTTPLNTLILPLTRAGFGTLLFRSSALYDGATEMQVLRLDGNYDTFASVNTGNQGPISVFGNSNDGWDNAASVYPYQVRVKVTMVCTLGNVTIWFAYFNPPGNPLF